MGEKNLLLNGSVSCHLPSFSLSGKPFSPQKSESNGRKTFAQSFLLARCLLRERRKATEELFVFFFFRKEIYTDTGEEELKFHVHVYVKKSQLNLTQLRCDVWVSEWLFTFAFQRDLIFEAKLSWVGAINFHDRRSKSSLGSFFACSIFWPLVCDIAEILRSSDAMRCTHNKALLKSREDRSKSVVIRYVCM